MVVKTPAKAIGANRSLDQSARRGPSEAITPPASTSEIARLLKASLAASAAANR